MLCTLLMIAAIAARHQTGIWSGVVRSLPAIARQEVKRKRGRFCRPRSPPWDSFGRAAYTNSVAASLLLRRMAQPSAASSTTPTMTVPTLIP